MHYRFWGLLDSCLAAEESIDAVNLINRAVRSSTHRYATPCATAVTIALPESDKAGLKIRQSLPLFSVPCHIKNINLPLNTHRLFCCFYAKIPAIQIHLFVYLYMRSVASTQRINSSKNNLLWTSHWLFKAPKNRNWLSFNW